MNDQILSTKKKLEWKFKNLQNWDGHGLYSGRFQIDNFDWQIFIEKVDSTNDLDDISVGLICTKFGPGRAWFCTVDANFTLGVHKEGFYPFKTTCRSKKRLCHDKHVQTVIFQGIYLRHETQNHTTNNNRRAGFGQPRGYSFQDLNPKSSIKIEVDFDLIVQDFSNSVPDYTDIVLNVGYEKVHANKKELSMNSEYFYDLFNAQKGEDGVFEIDKDIKLSDILSIFSVINSRNMLLSYNIFSLGSEYFGEFLDTVDRFKIFSLHSKIALDMRTIFQHPPNPNNTIDYSAIRLKCLKFADKYGYSDILNYCVDSFNSAQEIKLATTSEDFIALKPETKVLVLHRILYFIKI